MRLVSVVLLVAVLGAAGCASGESFVKRGYDFGRIEKVAVAEVEGAVRGEAAKNQVADYFAMEFMGKGYGVVERRQVQAAIEEQQFQASDLTSREGVARAGEILNVQAIVVVNVATFGEEMTTTAKLIGVEDAELLWIASGTGGTGRTLGTIGGAAVGGTAGAVMGGSTGGRIAAGVAGAVLGGVAGRALSPQEMALARKMVRKACKGLPERPMAPLP